MISFLRGVLLEACENFLVVEVQGIGYEVTVPPRLVRALPPPGKVVELYTHLHVRPEGVQLFGFLKRADRNLFRLLLRVPGIGPRVALTIVDTLPQKELRAIVASGNAEGLLQVPGVGRKSAQRLLLELRERVSLLEEEEEKEEADEAYEALLALGYSPREAAAALRAARAAAPGADAAATLRHALRTLGQGRR